jgi:hypothetical protein
MSQDESTTHAEDLELDGSESESVVGGRSVSRFESEQAAAEEIFRLSNQGYVETACMANGTLMENPKTGHRVAVKFNLR